MGCRLLAGGACKRSLWLPPSPPPCCCSYGFWPPSLSYMLVFSRSPPYLAGMAAALVVNQASRAEPPPLPTRAPSNPSNASSSGSRADALQNGEGLKDAGEEAGDGSGGLVAAAATAARGAPRQRSLRLRGSAGPLCTLGLDLLALAVVLGLAYCGVGDDR